MSRLRGADNFGYEQDYDSEQDSHVMNRVYLEEKYNFNNVPSSNIITSARTFVKKYYTPSKSCMGNYFYKRFPFFRWIQDYDFKQNIGKDLLAGFTMGIIQIPQGLAYAQMASMPPINGLYVTFILVLQYAIFGTSRHISAGTYAIVSLVVATTIKYYAGIYYPIKDSSETINESNYTSTKIWNSSGPAEPSSDYISDDPTEAKVIIGGMLALQSGLFMILFSILQIGAFTKYLSDPIVQGFTVGAGYHVVVSQIPNLLGLTLEGIHWFFVIPGELFDAFKNIDTINWATFIITIIFIPLILFIKWLNDRYIIKKIGFGLSVELVSVVIGTFFSWVLDLKNKYNVEIIGQLRTGFPAPSIPKSKVVSEIFVDLIPSSLQIAILTFVLNISIAKSYARIHKYDIKANQELFTYGLGNVIVSFFSGFPGCIGLSRTVINDEVGVKSQVSGFFTSALLLIVILWIGPLFEFLPNAVLATVIVISLTGKLAHIIDLPVLLRKSKIEALGWLFTLVGVLFINVDIGVYIGTGVSILMIIFKTQRARVSVMGNIRGTSVFECIDTCTEASEFPGIKIIRYEESVYYANVDNFKYNILKISETNPNLIQKKIDKQFAIESKKLNKACAMQKKMMKKNGYSEGLDLHDYVLNQDGKILKLESEEVLMKKCREKVVGDPVIKFVILDCSCMNYIDTQGVNCILDLYQGFKSFGVDLYMSFCKQQVVKAFRKDKEINKKFDFNRIMTSTNEAVRYILSLTDHSFEISIISDRIINDANKKRDKVLESSNDIDKSTIF